MMKYQKLFFATLLSASILCLILNACEEGGSEESVDPNFECSDVATVVPLDVRGACNESLSFSPSVSILESGQERIIRSNSIPDHAVGAFGNVAGSLNPNAIQPIEDSYSIPLNPSLADEITPLLNTNTGPEYEFGILLNGVLLDPEAAEPWPHEGFFTLSSNNWEWNLDAMRINLGLDCNNAHVQPSGKYHHHGTPTLYLESIQASPGQITLIGYAADGFPIYFNYGYALANDTSSAIISLKSSYQLKSGERPGDGSSAPCGAYTGIYTNDYEYIAGLGDLDECNGRTGVTPEYPEGTYYYVLTDSEFPFVPRCLMGTPSNDFRLR